MANTAQSVSVVSLIVVTGVLSLYWYPLPDQSSVSPSWPFLGSGNRAGWREREVEAASSQVLARCHVFPCGGDMLTLCVRERMSVSRYV